MAFNGRATFYTATIAGTEYTESIPDWTKLLPKLQSEGIIDKDGYQPPSESALRLRLNRVPDTGDSVLDCLGLGRKLEVVGAIKDRITSEDVFCKGLRKILYRMAIPENFGLYEYPIG